MQKICLMVRENHKMVREMSGKSQGILWGLMAGPLELPILLTDPIPYTIPNIWLSSINGCACSMIVIDVEHGMDFELTNDTPWG